MICYRDRTYCISPNCVCGRKLTPEIEAAAEEWWGKPGAPIAMSYFCGGEPDAEPVKVADKGRDEADTKSAGSETTV